VRTITVFGFIVFGRRYELIRVYWNDCLGDDWLFVKGRDIQWLT
jgi:hypothetical protein